MIVVLHFGGSISWRLSRSYFSSVGRLSCVLDEASEQVRPREAHKRNGREVGCSGWSVVGVGTAKRGCRRHWLSIALYLAHVASPSPLEYYHGPAATSTSRIPLGPDLPRPRPSDRLRDAGARRARKRDRNSSTLATRSRCLSDHTARPAAPSAIC